MNREEMMKMVDEIFSYFANNFSTGGRTDVHKLKHHILTKYLGSEAPQRNHFEPSHTYRKPPFGWTHH